jgi:hypothetical protein
VIGAVLLATLQQTATVTISSELNLLIVGVMLVFFVVAMLAMRKSRRRVVLAWIIVLGLSVLGEVVDLYNEHREGSDVALFAHWHDLWNTMLWPTIIAVLMRFTGTFRPQAKDGVQRRGSKRSSCDHVGVKRARATRSQVPALSVFLSS